MSRGTDAITYTNKRYFSLEDSHSIFQRWDAASGEPIGKRRRYSSRTLTRTVIKAATHRSTNSAIPTSYQEAWPRPPRASSAKWSPSFRQRDRASGLSTIEKRIKRVDGVERSVSPTTSTAQPTYRTTTPARVHQLPTRFAGPLALKSVPLAS